MITKIRNIKNLAVFENFNWDENVLDSDNQIKEFTDINILYGRNYSGKTTLSRIVRAMETDILSDKYENPEFIVDIKNENSVNQNNFTSHNKTIRVFNEDFIKENLKFIIDHNQAIQSFAIFGTNVNLEAEIQELKNTLGSKIEGEETKLYKDLKNLEENFKTAQKTHSDTLKSLEDQIKYKAINNPNGIKYKSEKFGDQNYTTNKLKNEILEVLNDNFVVLNDEQKKIFLDILDENKKDPIQPKVRYDFKLKEFSKESEELVTKEISSTDKIEELVKDAILNKWVKEGRIHHKNKREVCAFCNNKITESRWVELENHFDEESENLEKFILMLISKIDKEIDELKQDEIIYTKDQFYTEYHDVFETIFDEYSIEVEKYIKSIKSLKDQLNKRKDDLLNLRKFEEPLNNLDNMDIIWEKFEELRIKSDQYSNELDTKQNEAKKSLRLQEVYDFTQEINYISQNNNIAELKVNEEIVEIEKNNKLEEIKNILVQIDNKQKEQKDERKGAAKVREYLSDFFGHKFLDLDAVEVTDEVTGNKNFVFEIQRDGKKAYHLSEGEQSLISFCYFMAKLQDINTKSKKPIIWIDDPISSLDSNHIFFLYSLIKKEILSQNDFEQLFIATHNLNFLKYLKRLTGSFINSNSKLQEYNKSYFAIYRHDKYSTISLMPKYLKEYVTEFNYLFHQIYKCSQIEEITDANYTTFYNFGNNSRKFLE
ncbi:MAG: AAA family ATPase, partial [Spirochaetes bacterium]|nr:AAA family ATPase [Spirochaetota bacterium]